MTDGERNLDKILNKRTGRSVGLTHIMLEDGEYVAMCYNGLTGKTNGFICTSSQAERLYNWASSGIEMIQDAMPNLEQDLNEMCLSGITGKEWDEMFPPEANS